MGGLGSGAQRSTHIGNVEDMIAIDIRALRRLGFIRPGECVIDRVRWANGGLGAPSARLRIDLCHVERGGVMLIEYSDTISTIKQSIAVNAVLSGLGGWRCYFICPVTGRRCEIVYLSSGLFACREAQRLSYAVKSMNAASRARRKVAKLRSRLRGLSGEKRPRGRKRVKISIRLQQAELEAKRIYFDQLTRLVDQSGSTSIRP